MGQFLDDRIRILSSLVLLRSGPAVSVEQLYTTNFLRNLDSATKVGATYAAAKATAQAAYTVGAYTSTATRPQTYSILRHSLGSGTNIDYKAQLEMDAPSSIAPGLWTGVNHRVDYYFASGPSPDYPLDRWWPAPHEWTMDGNGRPTPLRDYLSLIVTSSWSYASTVTSAVSVASTNMPTWPASDPPTIGTYYGRGFEVTNENYLYIYDFRFK
jgi:hypothetical protein